MKEHERRKYLKKALLRQAEPFHPAGMFEHWIVIPVMDELEELPGVLSSLDPALPEENAPGILLVVNHSPDAPESRRRNNEELLRRLRNGMYPGVFWIDAASEGLELTGGVGEARKIGMDTAWSMIPADRIRTSLLVSLDADSPVMPDYWREITAFFASRPECGALSVGVRHRQGRTPEEEAVIRKYEHYMAHYVGGLRRAGSPYAFFTIGSAIAVRGEVYAASGGMRIRRGGEDFYFLQAVAKIAPVGSLAKPLVCPSPRPSDRVPFGTGPAVRALLNGRQGAFRDYPEAGFDALKELLNLAQSGMNEPETWQHRLPRKTRNFLAERGFFAAWEKILKNTPDTDSARLQAFHRWFDGLKTLQFIKSFF